MQDTRPWSPVHPQDHPPHPLTPPSQSTPTSSTSPSRAIAKHSPAVLTPPPSQPNSQPASPQASSKTKLRMSALEPFETGELDRLSGAGGSGEGVSKDSGAGLGDGSRKSSLKRSKGRSSRPEARVAFPTTTGYEGEEEDFEAILPFARGSTPTLGRAEGRRIVSETTTTTTSTMRKTERRHVRYSLPSDFDDYLEDENLPPRSPSRLSHSRSQHHRNSTSSPSRYLPSSSGRPHSPSPSSSKTRRSSSNSRSSAKPRRSSSLREGSPAGRGAKSGTSGGSWRSSPSTANRSSGPASSSPFFHRSFNGGTGFSVRSRTSSTTSTASSSAPNSRPTSHTRTRPSRSLRQDSDASDLAAFANSLTSTTLPFVRPFVSAFAFLAVSCVAALTVSAVLVASFSLTFYDDCIQRVGTVQRSLGGVRSGVQRLIGGAKGALEIAVRATNALGGDSESTTGEGGQGAKRRRTAMPVVPEQEDGEDDFRVPPRSRQASGGESFPTSAPSSGNSTPRASPSSYFSSPLRPFTSLPREAPGPSFPTFEPSTLGSGAGGAGAGWNTDEDALPYDVPHPTPRSSRAPSPSRMGGGRVPRSRTSTGASTSSSSASSALPPRPPLAVLIPSIVFALLFTIAKVLAGALRGKGKAATAA